MKHLTYYAPEKIVMPAYKRAEYLSGAGRKNATIFHNIIFINTSYLSIEEFINSFNDIDKSDYLNPDYKDKIVQAYWENQREFPNEDLMCFDQDISYFEKSLAAKYTKNEEMLTHLSQDDDFMIREILASRKDLPDHIINKLISDPSRSVRMYLAKDYPLSKEQIKLFAKDSVDDIVRILFANPRKAKIDDEIIDHFVKYGSMEIKKYLLCLRHPLTNEQIEYLLMPAHSNLEIKCLLAMIYKLSEKALLNLLKTDRLELLSRIAYRDDLTIPMIIKLIDKNDSSLNIDLARNKSLRSIAPQIYQNLMLKVLQDDDPNIVKKALYNYVSNLSNDLTLSSDILAHLVEVNYKNGDNEFANLILGIPDIPQYMVERVAFDSSINHLIEFDYNYGEEYDMIGIHTPYFHLVLMIKDYVQKVGYARINDDNVKNLLKT
jgi:hypothetical protein